MKAIKGTVYANAEAPPKYKCGRCGAQGVKLWRDYQTFMEHQRLFCADCAVKDQKKNFVVGEDGRHDCLPMGRNTTIGWLVPAIPDEEGEGFWGHTSVPKEGFDWWQRLPTRKGKGQDE